MYIVQKTLYFEKSKA